MLMGNHLIDIDNDEHLIDIINDDLRYLSIIFFLYY